MSELDATSELFLSFIGVLDSYGAQEWSLRMVTATVRKDVSHVFKQDVDGLTFSLVVNRVLHSFLGCECKLVINMMLIGMHLCMQSYLGLVVQYVFI